MLAVIIVDYNSLDVTASYIKHCIERIKGSRVHYIVVDNFQTDDPKIRRFVTQFSTSPEYLQYREINIIKAKYCDSEIIYARSGDNLGYAKGNNLGVNIAERLFGDMYYLISNNDIFIPSEINLNNIIEIFETDKKIAVIGPKIVGKDGNPQSPHKKISSKEHLIKYYLSLATSGMIKWNNELDYTNKSKYCYRVMGSFMFIKANALREVGYFDSNTFMFAEEMILSAKLENKKYKTFFYNDITVIHDHGESVDKNSSVEKALRWSFESRSYYYGKYRNASPITLYVGRITFNIYIVLCRVKKYVARY